MENLIKHIIAELSVLAKDEEHYVELVAQLVVVLANGCSLLHEKPDEVIQYLQANLERLKTPQVQTSSDSTPPSP